jgi:hypothetical protein
MGRRPAAGVSGAWNLENKHHMTARCLFFQIPHPASRAERGPIGPQLRGLCPSASLR